MKSRIGISHRAHAANPTLGAWLTGAGIVNALVEIGARPERGAVRILHSSEIAQASCRDIMLDIAEGVPELVRATAGMPARIRFGFADMAFGNALIAELVRPADRPACGEPESAAFLNLAARIAKSDATALVLGETGTGKEGLARFIHAGSRRAEGPFVAINCAALPDTMLEAMLFGHQKGSFTGAGTASEGLFRAADGGTLLLDEIAEMPLPLQAKLLRALQEREVLPVGATKPVPVNVRVIAAANRDLVGEVAAGRFRADLYWRLNVMPLNLKPLRERRLDVRAIAAALIVRHADAGETFPWPTVPALDRLMAHCYPGNVRELENVVQRAILLRGGERIEAEDLTIDPVPVLANVILNAPFLPSEVEGRVSGGERVSTSLDTNGHGERAPVRLSEVSKSVQHRAIEDALAATGGHRQRAAERLGISERTLRYRLADMRQAA